MKNFCVSKNTIKKVERQPTEWEKVFSNMSNNILVSRNLNNKKINTKFLKWAEDLNSYSSICKCTPNTQKSNKHVKGCSTLFVIREIQSKTTIRYYFTTTRMFIIKKVDDFKSW